MNTVSAGRSAEQAVAARLASQGYKVLELNWKTKFAEIDIVAQKAKTMYFVEVKYRRNTYAGDGFDYITHEKLHHMQRAAEAWVKSYGWQGEYALLAASVLGNEPYHIDIREVA